MFSYFLPFLFFRTIYVRHQGFYGHRRDAKSCVSTVAHHEVAWLQ